MCLPETAISLLISSFSLSVFTCYKKKKKVSGQLLQFFKCQFQTFYCEKKWEWWVDRYQNEPLKEAKVTKITTRLSDQQVAYVIMSDCQFTIMEINTV